MIVMYFLLACFYGEKQNSDDASASFPESPDEVSSSEFENVNCHTFNGAEGYGAATYYVGNFVVDGDTVRGLESVFFIANDNLSERPGWESGGCEMHWGVSGSTTDPRGCASCDVALSLEAELSLPDSTCPEDLQSGFESMTLFYNVQQEEDGSAVWYMESGTYLGEGVYRDNGEMTYVSDEDCKWF